VWSLVLGATYERIADSTCSATTLRTRRDEWIAAGLFHELEDICLRAYDQVVGLDLGDVTVDGCIVKAPCGGEAAGKSPVDRGKLGTKRSLLVDSTGVPLGCVVAPANRHDSPLLRPTLAKLARFDEGWAYRTRSRCTWTPGTTAPRPATCSTSWAATA
jgi:transposase